MENTDPSKADDVAEIIKDLGYHLPAEIVKKLDLAAQSPTAETHDALTYREAIDYIRSVLVSLLRERFPSAECGELTVHESFFAHRSPSSISLVLTLTNIQRMIQLITRESATKTILSSANTTHTMNHWTQMIDMTYEPSRKFLVPLVRAIYEPFLPSLWNMCSILDPESGLRRDRWGVMSKTEPTSEPMPVASSSKRRRTSDSPATTPTSHKENNGSLSKSKGTLKEKKRSKRANKKRRPANSPTPIEVTNYPESISSSTSGSRAESSAIPMSSTYPAIGSTVQLESTMSNMVRPTSVQHLVSLSPKLNPYFPGGPFEQPGSTTSEVAMNPFPTRGLRDFMFNFRF